MPAPNRSPTTFMPSISGPSITSSGRAARLPRLLGVLLDEVDDAVDERVREPLLDRRLAPGEVELALRPLALRRAPANSTSRSVASGRRLKITSSTRSSSSGSMSS